MRLLLKRGDALLGTLNSYEDDFPWVNCKFEPTEAFAEVRPLFDEELRLLNAQDFAAWEESYDKISALGLTLTLVDDGEAIENFLLHISGCEAWFRF